MSKLSNRAFAIMGMCEEQRKPFGIIVDPRGGAYAFCWAFKISDAQAKREGYDKTHVHGAVIYDSEFNGCPYCEDTFSLYPPYTPCCFEMLSTYQTNDSLFYLR